MIASILASVGSSTAEPKMEVDPAVAAVAVLSGQVVILDVRAPFERRDQAWRPDGTEIYQLPYGRSQWQGAIDAKERRSFLEGFMTLHLRDKEILIVCERGARSYAATLVLERYGFQTRSIAGGLWGDSGGGGFAQILADEIEFGSESVQSEPAGE